MTPDVLATLPVRHGHFVLESGYHTDLWLTLDALFVEPATVAPLIGALAAKLRPHAVSAVCGPLLGGAFLAQAIATALEVSFFYTEPMPDSFATGFFKVEYRLSSELRRRAAGSRVAVVDDVISAGSSVRATVAALGDAEASTAVVGAFLVLGDRAIEHFAAERVPIETLGRRGFTSWAPDNCALCREGAPLEDPRSSD